MATWAWILIAAAVVCVIVLGAAWATMRTRRTHALQDRFGGEYDRTVEREGGRRSAERELREREKRHEELELKPLPAEARSRYLQRWHATQERFVDDPKGAVAEADQLVEQVMEDRGYPVEHFDQQAADISVDHPDLVEKYRTAHGIAMASERGTADTEDLRHSVRHYRALFVELLGAGAGDDLENVDDVSGHERETADPRDREQVGRER